MAKKIDIGGYKISQLELNDRIILALPNRQFKAIAKQVKKEMDQMIIDKIPKGQFAQIIQKIHKDLEREHK